MNNFKRVIYSLICLFASLLISSSPVAAKGEFQEDYDVQYDVAPTGITIVTQKIKLTNQLTNLYPQKYSIIIDSEHINNVIAYDGGGVVTPEINQDNHKTQILLPFNERIVGFGKQLTFSLRYEDSDIAKKNGSVWEVNVPGIPNDSDLSTYNVSLKVPPVFGPNSYMSPVPSDGSKWTKDQMIHGGISAAFGSNQVFDVSLSYFLQNRQLSTKTMEIALPPTTAFQTVLVRSLDPKPKTVLQDPDGNWLAQYDVPAASHIDIHASITTEIFLRPKENVTTELSDPSEYLRPTKYWESSNPKIKSLADRLKTPQDIYTFVVNTLSYDYKRVNALSIRKGALMALESPKNSICMEFTDLFVALARAAGIPSREVVGFAYTNNARLRPLSLVSDVLHVWPEYYDQTRKIWVPVDPTWANTTGGVDYFNKLDFNHIAFALQGRESDYPYPAGFYKQEGSATKDVNVQFSIKPLTLPDAKLTSSFDFPKNAFSGFPANGSVILSNDNGVSISDTTITIQSSPFDVGIVQNYAIIPPYAKIRIPVSIPLPGYFMHGTGRITTSINGEIASYDFSIVPLMTKFVLPITLIVVPLIMTLSLVGIHLWNRRKK